MRDSTQKSRQTPPLNFGPEAIQWPEGELGWFPDAIDQAHADEWLRRLIEEISWSEERLTLFGREVLVPRLVAWYGDPGTDYVYSGVAHHPKPWNSALTELRQLVESRSRHSFNSVLANYYRGGSDSMGWHSDDEQELGPEPFIASLSFGETRKMRFRHRSRKGLTREIMLTHGSLLVMSGVTQQFWQHAIPKTRRVQGPRINLTFRHITKTAPA